MIDAAHVPTLIGALDDPDRSVRQRAAVELGTSGTAEAAAALVAHLGTETDCFVKETLTWATVQVGAEAVPGVLALLSSPDPAVRSQAAHVLSKIGDPTHAEALLPVVADDDPLVAVKAFRAAANTGSPTVIPALAGRLGDGDLEQREALTSAFATLGEQGVGVLLGALSDADASVRAHAADALGHLGLPLAESAVAPLTALLSDADPDVRFAAACALVEFGPEACLEPLRRTIADADPRVRAVARRALN